MSQHPAAHSSLGHGWSTMLSVVRTSIQRTKKRRTSLSLLRIWCSDPDNWLWLSSWRSYRTFNQHISKPLWGSISKVLKLKIIMWILWWQSQKSWHHKENCEQIRLACLKISSIVLSFTVGWCRRFRTATRQLMSQLPHIPQRSSLNMCLGEEKWERYNVLMECSNILSSMANITCNHNITVISRSSIKTDVQYFDSWRQC